MKSTLRRRYVDAATATADAAACEAIRDMLDDELPFVGRFDVRVRTVVGPYQVVTMRDHTHATHAVAVLRTDGRQQMYVKVLASGYSTAAVARLHRDTVRTYSRRAPHGTRRVIA